MRFLSIRWRIVLSYVLLTALTVSVIGAVALALVQRNLDAQEREFLTANAQVVAKQAANLMRPLNQSSLQGLVDTSAFLGSSQVRIKDTTGAVLADSGSKVADRMLWIASAPGLNAIADRPVVAFGFLTPLEGKSALSEMDARMLRFLFPNARFTVMERQSRAMGDRIGIGKQTSSYSDLIVDSADEDAPASSGELRLVSAPIMVGAQPIGTVELMSNVSYASAALATAGNAFLAAALGATALAVVIGLGVSSSLTAPLQKLAGAAQRMAHGDMAARAPAPHNPPRNEVDQLGLEFNDMADELETSFHQLSAERDALRNFITDASHELRTPITALRMSNELLQGPAGENSAERAEFLAQNEAQLARLQWITTNLLDLSRFDAGLMTLDKAPQDVSDLLHSAASGFALRAQKAGVRLDVAEPDQPIRLNCDRARMEMALTNLIDNALKFTPAGGSIILRAERGEKAIQLSVCDTGKGIPEKDLPHVFERFYRAQNASAPGSGLGLAIVKSIAQAHGGSVSAKSEIGKGSCFVVELPLVA
ncbi:MAG TPA: HAMP domain-containing sensor histidine kinase [Thermoflexales bacterium]|nr:HAMP domain-containing sensor histidine kinase [Thermoflexales bacterium]HQW35893.1 HAMP domain-containing sensor histidine kinase [Thermoflexales bacterium]HQZ22917.1 HAMP domain-containing sensor histidine kinase [Thermoflexales bacterium]HRA00191.1 HAMP domain-containing sensor histidine kinase [Thermoflexales bacterium]